MQFMKLRRTELKQSALGHFCIQSAGNNFTIENPVTEAVVLQLSNELDVAEQFPFVVTSIEMPTEHLATNLLKDADMRKIYDNCSVLEQQEFGLDPLYVSECSVDPAKQRQLQVRHSPAKARKQMLAIVTTYGACHILTKIPYGRHWQQIGNLTKLLLTDVFPIDKSPTDLHKYQEVKNFLNFYVMTACTWHNNGHVVYAANAAGYIMAFGIEYTDGTDEKCAEEEVIWKPLAKLATDFSQISFMKDFDDYLIVVGIDGTIGLFRFMKTSMDASWNFESIGMLWDHIDQMCCRQIVVQKCQKDGGYVISFAKGAYVICIKISDEGKLEGRSNLYLPGIKITGLELYHENMLIATTINAKVMRVIYTLTRENNASVSLHLKADPVHVTGLDVGNVQILGLGATTNKALWLLMTHCNRETPASLKHSIVPSQLTVFKPSTIDPLVQLNNKRIDTMDPYHDLIMALRMDIWHANVNEQFNHQYSFASNIKLQKHFDGTFLTRLQLQLEISRTLLRRSRYKMRRANEVVSFEVAFLELATQIVHIILRLEYLQEIIDSKRLADESASLSTLNEFQRKSAKSMTKIYYILMKKLKTTVDEVSKKEFLIKFEEFMRDFIDIAVQNLYSRCQDFEADEMNSKEKCLFCDEHINSTSLMCQNGHNMKRCCVSFVQVPWFNNRFCLQCGTMALECQGVSDLLLELFPSTESVKCTFCRSAFVNKESLN